MYARFSLLSVLLSISRANPSTALVDCATDVDCSLNGVCAGGSCVCDAPWGGAACAVLTFAATPPSGRNIYNSSDPRNTWGGPIAGPGPDGKYHAYVPLYEKGSLWHVEATLHGVADAPAGPWDFSARPNISSTAINPAFLAYPNGSGGTVFSLWTAGGLLTSNSLDGPFERARGGLGATNPAPIYHGGAFYATSQATREVLTAPTVTGPWTFYANITHPEAQGSVSEECVLLPTRAPPRRAAPPHPTPRFTPHPPTHPQARSPFLWVDTRGRWHVINHAYNTSEFGSCGGSHVSTHFFSEDGKTWFFSDQPYGHTVTYSDGTSHTFATLERPNLLFNAAGQPAFLTVAVDLDAGEQCASHECCACCKFHDHAGTAVIALAV